MTGRGNFDPSTAQPLKIPGKHEQDFAEREFELEFLRALKGRKDSTTLSSEVPLSGLGYSAVNRVKNLKRSGYVEFRDPGRNGKYYVSITPEGEEWLEQFKSQQHGAYKPQSVDPGGWNPVSGSNANGYSFF